MNSRKMLLAGASLLALTTVLTQTAQAGGPPACSTQGTITGSCSGLVTLTGDLVVASTGAVVAMSSTAVKNAIQIGALSNQGVISGTSMGTGVYNSGSIGVLTNDGLINVLGKPGAGILNSGPGATITTLKNTGTIRARVTNTIGGSPPFTDGIRNEALLGELINEGLISVRGTTGTGIANIGGIGKLSNSGMISAEGNLAYGIGNTGSIMEVQLSIGGTIGAVASNAYGIGNAGSIGQLSNDGEISANGYTSANGIGNIGNIGTLSNSGVIAARAQKAYGIGNVGSITELQLSNSGQIVVEGSTAYGISNGGNIGRLSNSGEISVAGISGATSGPIGGVASGIGNTGSIGTLSNSGVISVQATGPAFGINNTSTITSLIIEVGGSVSASGPNAVGVANSGVINTLTNRGTINAIGVGAAGLFNNGTIDALSNSGTIQGGSNAIFNLGTLDTIGNSGVIDGNIVSNKSLTVTGGSAAVVGTLKGGNIVAPDVAFTAGNLLVQDNILVTGTVTNTGAALSLSSIVTITGNYSQTSGVLALDSGSELIVTGAASITGGTIISSATGNYLAGAVGPTLISAAGGLTYTGTTFSSGLTGLDASVSVVNGTDLVETFLSNYVGGTLPTMSFSGRNPNLVIGQTGTITDVTNGGTITGGVVAIINGGTIGSFGNSGTILTSDGLYGLQNTGTIGTFTNSGTITGSQFDIYTSGSIGTFLNSGHIGSPVGIEILAGGSIADLNNSGVISGTQYAIHNAGTLGVVTNSGTIDGNIFSANALTIVGGSGSTYGTLTNGTITAPGVTFTSGNSLLKDNIVAPVVTNSGATLQLDSAQAITGKYSQTAGVLALGSSGQLAVSDTATMTGGSVQASLASTANYIAGTARALVSGASGSSYNGVTVNAALTGLDLTIATASTKDLVLAYQSHYVGGALASLANTGTVGVTYGLYVASSGNLSAFSNSGTLKGTSFAIYNVGVLGPITNSGTINGNISSVSSLTVIGGSGTAFGTLTGGTITAPGVTFSSGNTLLKDNIVANNGTGTVTNSGAVLRLDSAQAITGNYTQTGGTLQIDVTSATSFGSLTVSGAATVTNSAINLTGSGLAYGQTFTVVSGGAASSYTGDTVSAGSFFAMLRQSGNNLVVMLGLPFESIGDSVGGDAKMMGGILEPLQSNSGFASALTALGGVSTVAQGNALKQAAPAQVGGGAAALQRGMLMTGQIDQAIGQRAKLAQTDNHGWSLWGQMMGGLAKRGAKGAVETYGISSWGLTMGADTRLNESMVVGGAMSWGSGWNGGTGVLAANTNRVNSYQLTAYGSWSRGALAVTGQTAVGFDSYDQHRLIDVTSQTARTSYDGHHYEMAVNGGYAIPMDKVTLTPTASLKWLRVATAGYTETGAGFFNLSVNSSSQDQVESGLGFKLGTTFDSSLGVLEPELKAMWLHDFVNGAILTNAAISGVSFATTAVRPGPNGVELGAGLALYHAGDVSLRVSYDGEFRGGYTAHTGQMQIKLAL